MALFGMCLEHFDSFLGVFDGIDVEKVRDNGVSARTRGIVS